MIIMPVCRIDRMKWIYNNHCPDWLISWYKGSTGHRSYIGFNDWEPHLVYGKIRKELKMHDFFQTNMKISKDAKKYHPCPKPNDWAKWIILKATKINDIIYDPFMGSGTVIEEAILNNRKYIGNEIGKNYFKYCKKREIIAKNKIKNTKLFFCRRR